MTVESSPLLHTFVCWGATYRNNSPKKYVSPSEASEVSLHIQNTCALHTMTSTTYSNFSLVVKRAIIALLREYFCVSGNPSSIVMCSLWLRSSLFSTEDNSKMLVDFRE